MKINKYNETNTDNIYYEGDITVHFKVLKKDIEKYSSIFRKLFNKSNKYNI
jgi:pyruvate/2-oxoglutarate dehydrogenase complex dihydrolipoamide dehydrogenase (E3) component